MKTITSLVVTCLFCCVMYAQNNYINYKALVKDDLGNVVASQGIDVRFTIFSDAVQVYVETHNPTTDANGIIILDIGSGTTVDVFTDIDWSTTTSLKTEIDTGSGYVDMGTTEFKSVPYALNSGNTVFNNEAGTISNSSGNTLTDDFVFGSTQLAHSAAENIEDSRFFFDNSLGAFRAGVTENRPTATPSQDGTAWNISNIGVGSFASGFNTIASGSYSTSLGFVSEASGEFSTAIGDEVSATGERAVALGSETTASGDFSTTFGRNTLASGFYATAMGKNTIARSFASLSIGRHNEGIGDPTAWILEDPILEIGNGTDDANRSNALTVLKNGIILAPTFELSDYDFSGPKSLVTKEYADAQAGALSTTANVTSNAPGDIGTDDFVFGSEQLDNASGTQDNNRMFFNKSKGAFRVGNASSTTWDNINVGNVSFASGQNTTASGNFSTAVGENATASNTASTAMGKSTMASGLYSTAMGDNATASGTTSTAMGKFTMASGLYSTAMGENATASGNYSTAMGSFTRAESVGSTAIGLHNVGGGGPNSLVATDPLFEIGNGTNSSNRSNALTVLRNGKTTVSQNTANNTDHAINGIKSHTGFSDSSGVFGENTVEDYYGVGVTGEGGWKGVEGTVNGTASELYYGVIGNSTGTNIGTNYGVYGYASNGATNYAVYADGNLAYTGTLINASDRKVKTNISTINNSLEDIMRLNPTSYLIRESYQKTMNMSDRPQFGFIAQELQEVFPDLVSRNIHPGATKQDASIEYLGVNYIGLIPILTKGIQEQQATIETLEEKVERQEQVISSLIARLEALENR